MDANMVPAMCAKPLGQLHCTMHLQLPMCRMPRYLTSTEMVSMMKTYTICIVCVTNYNY